jgi:hypothetical protein
LSSWRSTWSKPPRSHHHLHSLHRLVLIVLRAREIGRRRREPRLDWLETRRQRIGDGT